MRFPEKLEKEMARRGKSQSAIARETGINQSAISAMTRDERRPYMDQALRLARALEVPLDYLADDDADEPPASDLTEDEERVLEFYRHLRDTGAIANHNVAIQRLGYEIPRRSEPIPGVSDPDRGKAGGDGPITPRRGEPERRKKGSGR